MRRRLSGVDLRVESPFPAWAWPLAWEWFQKFRDRVCDEFSPATREEFVARMAETANPEDTWGVWRDEQLGGLIWTPIVTPYLANAHTLFKRSFWGRETTVQAARLVYAQVFDRGVGKIASAAFADNHQVRAFARELGWVEEGTLRKHTRRNGQPIDMVAFGLLKEEFYATCCSSGDISSRRASERLAREAQDADHDPGLQPEPTSDPGPGGEDNLRPPGESGQPRPDEDFRNVGGEPEL